MKLIIDYWKVGIHNTTGQHYRGHFDLNLINKRQNLLNHDLTRRHVPSARVLVGWVNGGLYVQTKEKFIILPVPENICTTFSLRPYDSEAPPKRHRYLASKQGTLFPVLTLHTPEEKTLFSQFMLTEHSFLTQDWNTATVIWNRKVDGLTLFYKVGY